MTTTNKRRGFRLLTCLFYIFISILKARRESRVEYSTADQVRMATPILRHFGLFAFCACRL